MADRDSKFWVAALLVVLAGQAALFAIDLTAPWVGVQDWNGFLWSQAAHNHLRAGLGTTIGVPAWEHFGPLPIPPEAYSVHHPPLLAITLSGLFALLGEQEWVARLLPITCTLLSTLLLWWLVRDGVDARAATLAAAVFVVQPLTGVFGRMVNFEPCTLPWMLGALVSLRCWQRRGERRWLVALIACVWIGLWMGWHMHLLVLVLAALLLTQHRRREARLAVALLGLAVASVGLYLVQVRLVCPGAWPDLWERFLFRLSSNPGMTYRRLTTFTWGEWLQKLSQFLGDGVQPLAWVAAMGGAVYAAQRPADARLRELGWTALCLFLMNALYVLVWRNVSFTHAHAYFYFAAPVAMMAGTGLDAVWSWSDASCTSRCRRGVVRIAVLAAIAALAIAGLRRTMALNRDRYYLLDYGGTEPRLLVRELGRTIERSFPEDYEVLCNFPWDSPQLEYYARRSIAFQLTAFAEWQPLLARPGRRTGGIIWLGAPGADELVAVLPGGSRQTVRFGDSRFCMWRPD